MEGAENEAGAAPSRRIDGENAQNAPEINFSEQYDTHGIVQQNGTKMLGVANTSLVKFVLTCTKNIP